MKNFITFEGCEGAGKSTQIKMLKDYLDRKGIASVVTREPGGSPIAEKIRSVILDGQNTEMTAECELLLYCAARSQHLEEVIKPSLKSGKLVICDRYTDSSVAYQGGGRGIDKAAIENLNKIVVGDYVPELTIFLNIQPQQAFVRKGGADENDRLENQSLDFHNAVYCAYLDIAKKNDRFVAVDCSQDKQTTHNRIVELLKERKIID